MQQDGKCGQDCQSEMQNDKFGHKAIVCWCTAMLARVCSKMENMGMTARVSYLHRMGSVGNVGAVLHCFRVGSVGNDVAVLQSYRKGSVGSVVAVQHTL